MTRECQDTHGTVFSYSLDCYGIVHSQKPLRRGGFHFSSQFKGTIHCGRKVSAAGAGAAGHTVPVVREQRKMVTLVIPTFPL